MLSKNDAAGSVYLNILTLKKFSAFITTEQGHKFSIFVNPRQFENKRDFENYPRNYKNDKKILKKLKVKYL